MSNDGSECRASASASQTYHKYGQPTICHNEGIGSPEKTHIYKINRKLKWWHELKINSSHMKFSNIKSEFAWRF